MELYNPRLRALDLKTPWFWLTIFYRPRIYGDSWLILELWEPPVHRKWWAYFWRWEETPDTHGYEGEPLSEEEQRS